MYDYKPLVETALEVGISETSIFEIEKRIYEELDKIHNDIVLKGIVQVDEKYISTSFKEFVKEKMPRPSRNNRKDDRIFEIND